ncbi:MAG: hypothetical protein AAFQ51_05680 [Pseudomonadota bacterium]
MSETCDTVPVLRDRVTGPFYQLELFVSREACVTRTEQGYDTTEMTAFARFTNTGGAPVELTDVSTGTLQFRQLWDSFAPDEPEAMPGGPVDPAGVQTQQVAIAPGEARDSVPVQAFLALASSDIKKGRSLSGAPLAPEAENPRSFGLGFVFTAQVFANGASQVVSHPLAGEILVRIDRSAPE